MNNFQKMSAAVLVFGGLALGAFVSSMPDEPKKGDCITTLGARPGEEWNKCK